jgi:UDP-N-acetylglucosamine diphosphorylase/glucosamine-1-phosphate N-acetyltransferase
MSGYILCDTTTRDYLLPFTYTRPIADCRTGILTIRQKWEYWLKKATSTLTVDHLSERFPLKILDDNFWINGALIPDPGILEAMGKLNPGEQLTAGSTWLLTRCGEMESFRHSSGVRRIDYPEAFTLVKYPWDLSGRNNRLIRDDFMLMTGGRASADAGPGNTIITPENVFIEPGASVSCATINATEGPVYIGKDATIMEGALIRGPFALLDGATVKMGARIYGATTVGPHAVVGGEIKNSVLFGYSNKGHDGYLGDAVIGEWCNLGAGTNCSNLKNNISPVKIWNESGQVFTEAGVKCGMLMGDFSRTGIGTMINTGSLIGVSCNVFGAGFPPGYLPSFLWGGSDGLQEYRFQNALRDAEAWKQLKGERLSGPEKKVLDYVFNHTLSYRKYLLKS